MDFGNLFEKLEEDSRVLLLTLVFSFPIAYIDCWKLSPHFQHIDLIPQVILALGIAVFLTIGGILCNLLYIVWSDNIGASLSVFVSLLPSFVTSSHTVLWGGSPIKFVLIFTSWCLMALGIALLIHVTKERHAKKRRNKIEN